MLNNGVVLLLLLPSQIKVSVFSNGNTPQSDLFLLHNN